MNNEIGFKTLQCVVGIILIFTSFLASAGCLNLSEYRVKNINLSSVPLVDAVHSMISSTPINLQIGNIPDGLLVSASNVSGPLDKALRALLKKVGNVRYTYNNKDCVLQIGEQNANYSSKVESSQISKSGTSITPEIRAAAYAQVNKIKNSTVDQNNRVVTVRITEIGERPSVVSMVQISGMDYRLGSALQLIVPRSMIVYLDNDIQVDSSVSWRGGRDWVSILSELASIADFSAEIDWKHHTVMIRRSNYLDNQQVNQIDLKSSDSNIKSNIDDLKNDAQKSNDVQKKWKLEAGKPIHVQLAEWANLSGWTFSWRPQKSWIVPAEFVFNGSFDQAIAEVIELLYKQGKPVQLVIWEGNRFAEVIDVNIQ